jgi:ion channel-forming bestrophin family protein
MILKRNFNPIKVVQYVFTELLIAIIISLLVFVLHKTALITVTIPFSISAILGSALAIFVAFRNNTSYTRWWEARTVWGNIINNSRIFARQVIANANNAIAIGKASSDTVSAYKREVIYRQIAFAHALRMHLRGQNNYTDVQHLLEKSELNEIVSRQNIPNQLLLKQGLRIKEGMRMEILGAFDNISIEPTLAGFNNFQGACERIKNTPLLRQYDYYTRLFLYVFIITLPLALIGDFIKLNIDYLMPIVSVIISFVFATIGKVGEVNEDPFENRITDIPMTAMCNTIERDLMEMLGESNLPEKIKSSKGFLF